MRDFLEAVLDSENWKPNLTQISEQVGKTIPTIRKRISRMRADCKLRITVKDLSDSEAKLIKEEKE